MSTIHLATPLATNRGQTDWPEIVAKALHASTVLERVLVVWRQVRAALDLSRSAELAGAVLLSAELSPSVYIKLTGSEDRRVLSRAQLLGAVKDVLDDGEAAKALVELEERGVVRVIDGTEPWFAGEVLLERRVAARCLAGEVSVHGEHRSTASVRASFGERIAGELTRVLSGIERAGERRVLVVIRGKRGSGRDTVAGALLERLGRGALIKTPLELRAAEDPLEPELSGSAAVWDARPSDPSPDDYQLAERFLGRSLGVAVALLDREQDPPAPGTREVAFIDADPQNEREREEIWSGLLARTSLSASAPHDDGRVARRLAQRLRAGAGLAARALHTVQRTHPPPEGEAALSCALERAVHALTPPSRTRGVVVETPEVPLARLVISAAAATGLEHVLVLSEAGTSRAGGRGVTALFCGPSGTGKTLAARAIATTLDVPLYRVDLATIVSKWIGETEKNLRAALSASEASGAILFFDEGDSLLAKRGEVSRGTDRYANLEVSYLLQAMESHDGVVIVATNLKQNIDTAFFRRFDVCIEFNQPTPAERARLWKQELGALADGLPAPFLRNIASAELTGGNIASAGRLALALCARRGATSLSEADVMTAIAGEFQKFGSTVQGAQWAERARRHGGSGDA